MDSHEITNRFFYKKPTPEEVLIHEELSISFGNLALLCNRLIPDSREKALVITKLEEAKFFASAAVARRDPKTST